jgi:hypothetical protein
MLLGMSFFYPYWTSCIQEQADTPIAASFSSALRNVVEDLFEGSRAVKLSLVPIYIQSRSTATECPLLCCLSCLMSSRTRMTGRKTI